MQIIVAERILRVGAVLFALVSAEMIGLGVDRALSSQSSAVYFLGALAAIVPAVGGLRLARRFSRHRTGGEPR